MRQEDVSFDVWDKRRDRFEGGSGNDLLKTAADCNEVWGLKMKSLRLELRFMSDSSVLGVAPTKNATRCRSDQKR